MKFTTVNEFFSVPNILNLSIGKPPTLLSILLIYKCVADTFGYIPPEYEQSWQSTTKGDVYSFGVILLELVMGKEPTGPEFKDIEGGNLVGWVIQKIKTGNAVDVLDQMVLDADSKSVMLQTLQIAAVCLVDNPAHRPTMLLVLKFLKGIQDE